MGITTMFRYHRTTVAALVFSVIAILLCLFIFYIDEGHYSLSGILHLTNLLGLTMYFLLCLGLQLGLFWTLHRRIPYGLSLLISVGGLACFIFIFSWLVSS